MLDGIRRHLGTWLRTLAWTIEPHVPAPVAAVSIAWLRRRAAMTAYEWRRVMLHDPCVYCGGQATTSDHIQPASTGGSAHWSNRAPACQRCNVEKAATGLLQFLVARQPRRWRPVSPLMAQATATPRQQRRAAIRRRKGIVVPPPLSRPLAVHLPDMARRQATDVDLRRGRMAAQ